jgi:predicted RNA binding protein YcfA (HicA-like mRNA interferase family)
MSKELPSLTPKQVIKALEKIGFEFFRQKGSHKIYEKEQCRPLFPIIVKTLRKGLYTRSSRGLG